MYNGAQMEPPFHLLSLNCLVQNDCVNYLVGSWPHFSKVGDSTLVRCALLR